MHGAADPRLTLHPVLERAEAGAAVALFVAYLDDVSITGSPPAVTATFKRLLDAVPGLSGLELKLGKSEAHGSDTEEVATGAQELGIGHMHQGLTPVNTPLGAPVYVDTKLRHKRRRCSRWWTPW